MRIILNDAEQRLVRDIAKRRITYSRAQGAKATVYGDESAEFREVNSVGAELAFCKHHNIYPDLEPEEFGGQMNASMSPYPTQPTQHTKGNSTNQANPALICTREAIKP